jgi:hypothetical protein
MLGLVALGVCDDGGVFGGACAVCDAGFWAGDCPSVLAGANRAIKRSEVIEERVSE